MSKEEKGRMCGDEWKISIAQSLRRRSHPSESPELNDRTYSMEQLNGAVKEG